MVEQGSGAYEKEKVKILRECLPSMQKEYSTLSLKSQISRKVNKSQPLFQTILVVYILFSFAFSNLVEPLHLKVLNRRIAGMQLWWPIKSDGMSCRVRCMTCARSLLTLTHDI